MNQNTKRSRLKTAVNGGDLEFLQKALNDFKSSLGQGEKSLEDTSLIITAEHQIEYMRLRTGMAF